MSPFARANVYFIFGVVCLIVGIPLVLWGIMSPSLGFIHPKDLEAEIVGAVFGVALAGAGCWFFGKASYNSNNDTQENK